MTTSKYDTEIVPRLLTIWLDICANTKKGRYIRKAFKFYLITTPT